MKWLEKYADNAYALMRIVAGLMFSFHGLQIVFGVLSENQPPVGSQLWVGGLVELAAGLAVMLGIQTRVAALLASGTMAVAYLQYHWKFQIGPNFFPAVNQGELAALYCFVFLFIASRGGGKWSVDRGK
jgi:putative oxidoreductase